MWKTLIQRPDVLAASKIMVFDSIASEPDTAPLIAWCETMRKQTCMPEDADLDPTWPDAVMIGVCFAPQIVVDLPTDAHDVFLHAIVTD